MRQKLIALVIAGFPFLVAAEPPAWSVRLEGLGLERFDRDPVNLWVNRQGLIFLGLDRVLIYQVSRTPERAKLGPRQASGGAGNFLLNLKAVSSADGHLVKARQLITNAAISQVLGTREGRFLVRTGDKVTLYSATFEPLASREMKRERQSKWEDWQIKVSPSGEQIVLLHEQIFSEAEILADGSVLHDGKAKVDVEILEDRTLETRKSFTLGHTLAFWSPGEGFLVSSNPEHSYNDQQIGILNYEGEWSAVRPEFKMPKSFCGYKAGALDRELLVAYGCESFALLSIEGREVFSKNDGRCSFVSATASGRYLVLECESYRAGLTLPGHGADMTPGADRLQVYDIDAHCLVLSYHLESRGAYYALSSHGELVVADGGTLLLLRAKH